MQTAGCELPRGECILIFCLGTYRALALPAFHFRAVVRCCWRKGLADDNLARLIPGEAEHAPAQETTDLEARGVDLIIHDSEAETLYSMSQESISQEHNAFLCLHWLKSEMERRKKKDKRKDNPRHDTLARRRSL